MDPSALARIESQRAELETNIAKLHKALRHWQTLEIDYEGLREEFLILPDDSSAEECMKAARDSKPELVNERELRELLSDNGSRPRRPAQLVNLLSRRIEYVTRNVETVRKQLSDSEKKRNALLLAEKPDHRAEAGLPLAEIVEELDDSGQVISSKVQTPASDAPQLLDVLKKAGVEDLAESDDTIIRVESPSKAASNDLADTDVSEDDSGPLSATHDAPSEQAKASPTQLPINSMDTPEEAELRREMLDYSRGLDEVGAIVAELALEEGASDVSYDEDDADLDFDSEIDSNEEPDEGSEDETGKSKHSLTLSRGYEKRMEELQEKLGLKNVGPEAEAEAATGQVREEQRPPAAEAARKAALARAAKSESSLKPATKRHSRENKPGKKKVAFSSDLDIATEATPSTSAAFATPSSRDIHEPQARPINDSVVERMVEDNESLSVPALPSAQTAKQSRFKSARQAQPQTPKFAPPMDFPPEKTDDDDSAPRPPSQPIRRDLVERPSSKTTKAPDLTEFSDEAHHRQIAKEYQEHRIRRIQAQEGGFLGSTDEGELLLEDEESGRRVSRFKAARIQR